MSPACFSTSLLLGKGPGAGKWESTHLKETESAWARPSGLPLQQLVINPTRCRAVMPPNSGQFPALHLAPALRNGKISHAFGLEELMLLKWPYYQKQSTALMQSLSKYT